MEKRLNEIDVELRELQEELEGADESKLSVLEERVSMLETEKKGIEEDIEKRKKEEEALEEAKKNEMHLKTIEQKGKDKMDKLTEIRSSEEYIHAYANYVRNGRDEECRALMTDFAEDGTVPAPVFVDNIVQTSWSRLSLLPLIRRSEFAGALKVGVEISADPAKIHAEGGAAITEEDLSLAVVQMNPQTIKKWVSFTDEILDMNDRAFLEYIYDELTYQIAKMVEALVLAEVAKAPTDNSTGKVAAPKVEITAPGLADFVNAAGKLAGDIANPIIVTSRAVYAAYKALAMSAQYAVDPFDGMEVVFAEGMYTPQGIVPFGTTDGEIVAFVGDPLALHVNFVKGSDPELKYDDVTLATSDLVRVIGRMPVGVGYVKNNGFVTLGVDAQ